MNVEDASTYNRLQNLPPGVLTIHPVNHYSNRMMQNNFNVGLNKNTPRLLNYEVERLNYKIVSNASEFHFLSQHCQIFFPEGFPSHVNHAQFNLKPQISIYDK